MSTKPAPTPEPARRRGRPAIAPEDRRDHRFTFRLTKEELEKLDRLGGADWLRDRINHAKE